MNEEFSLEDILIILRRRIWYFVVPVLIIVPIGIGVIAAMPSLYRAEGKIMVESPQISTTLVQSTINTYAQERIQTIQQRVLTLNRSNAVADKFNIFENESHLSQTERAARIRERLNINLISIGRRRGASDGTVAFTVSFMDENPDKAYLVANEFMTMFLAEDARTRSVGASNTTGFFDRESEKLREKVIAIEKSISDFKVKNSTSLPSNLGINLNLLDRTNTDLNGLLETNAQLEEEKQFIGAQMINGAQSQNSLSSRLDSLYSQLAILRASYHDDYPEIKAVQQEISAIKRTLEPSREIQRLRNELTSADAKLTALERGSNATPEEITEAEVLVNAARQALSDQISKEARSGGQDSGNSYAEGRLAIIDNRLRMNQRRIEELRKQIADYEERVAKTPAVERELATLARDHKSYEAEYREVRAKQQDAQLAQNLQENDQTEKFSILEPAVRPHKPSSPDRPKLFVMVMFLAGAAGGGLALLAEFAFSTVRGRVHLGALVGEHPIAVVPYIPTPDDNRSPFGFLQRRKASDVANAA